MDSASTMEKRNAEAAGGSSKGSSAVVVAGSPRITRSSRAKITRIQGGNTDVAANAPAARGAKPTSPPAPAPAAAPSEESPTRKTPARTREKAPPAKSGNAVVAGKAPVARSANPLSPPAPAPAAGAFAENQMPLAVVAQLAEKGAEMVALKVQVEEPMKSP